MAEQHLRDLESSLVQRGWHVVEDPKPPGADRWGISGSWSITRGETHLRLDFEGRDADGLVTHPLERSYACHVHEHPETELWFRRRSHESSWRSDLRRFVATLDDLARAERLA